MRRSGVSVDRLLDPDHHRDARAVHVGVHQADAPSERMHREREVHRDRRFADAALAAGDRDDMLDARDCARLRHPGRAFGALCAGCSIWTLTAGTPGIAATVAFTSADDFLDDFGLGRRHRERHGDACVRDFDILDDPERDDVAGEARIFYFLEFGENFIWTRHCADRTCRWFRLGCGHAIKARRSCYHSGTAGKTTPRTREPG